MLRGDLGFEGVVVTDDLAMAGASGGRSPARAAVEAVEAGADLLIISSPPQQQADAYDAVVEAVESGRYRGSGWSPPSDDCSRSKKVLAWQGCGR